MMTFVLLDVKMNLDMLSQIAFLAEACITIRHCTFEWLFARMTSQVIKKLDFSLYFSTTRVLFVPDVAHHVMTMKDIIALLCRMLMFMHVTSKVRAIRNLIPFVSDKALIYVQFSVDFLYSKLFRVDAIFVLL